MYVHIYVHVFICLHVYVCIHTHNILRKNQFIALINLFKTGKLKEKGQAGTF